MPLRLRQHSSPAARSSRNSAPASDRVTSAEQIQSQPPSVASPLNSRTILQLQRMVGNRAVLRLLTSSAQRQVVTDGLVLQRKPADINGTYRLDFDIKKNKKQHINTAAPRAKGPTRTKAINKQAKETWVTPNAQLIGGHLFGAQFGGPDNDTNVVPWSEAQETAFSAFEATFQKQAMSDARKALPDQQLTLTIETAATFADRPDLKATDEELTTAGWGPTDTGRKERKDKLDDVAEQFSGIPKTVKVTVKGLSTGDAVFEPGPADIAPTYTRNADALKPAFVPYKRYERHATEPRVLNTVPDWTLKRGPLYKDPLVQKLQHVATRHGDQLGVAKNGEPDNLKALEAKFAAHVAAPDTEQILGEYLGEEVTHYVNVTSNYWLCVDEASNLKAAFVLAPHQLGSLLARGTVG